MDQFEEILASSENSSELSRTDVLDTIGDRLNWCEPSLPIRLQDTHTSNLLEVRSGVVIDPLEEAVKYFVMITDEKQPVGLCQFATGNYPERIREMRHASSGSRDNYTDPGFLYLLEPHERTLVGKYLMPFQRSLGDSNAAFEVTKEYKGKGYGKLLLLMTQLLAKTRGIQTIQFRDDETMKHGEQSFYVANAEGESFNGNSTIKTEPTPALEDFFHNRFRYTE